MYYCNSCNADFEKPKILMNDAGEKYLACPFCLTEDMVKYSPTHCRCCGSLLLCDGDKYCSSHCREKGERFSRKQLAEKRIKTVSPINLILFELEEYNSNNHTDLSYGKYVALKEYLRKGKKKCAKKRKST